MVTFASAGSKLEFHGYTTDIIDANIFLDVSSFSVIMIVKKLNWSLLIGLDSSRKFKTSILDGLSLFTQILHSSNLNK